MTLAHSGLALQQSAHREFPGMENKRALQAVGNSFPWWRGRQRNVSSSDAAAVSRTSVGEDAILLCFGFGFGFGLL